MGWRIARSLDVLLEQLNSMAPNRSKVSDGGIGDVDHQNRSSDHNPWYGPGIVTARDVTHDPAGGLDCQWLADTLAANRDPRIKYVIWNRRILDARPGNRPWQWVGYSGTNPHTKHLHLSVVAGPANDSTALWAGISPASPTPPPEVPDVELTDKIVWWDGKQVSVKDVLAEVYLAARGLAGKRPFDTDPAVTPAVQLAALQDIKTRLAALEARPAVTADVDEAALAAELDARGIGGVSAAELIQILASTRLVPTQEGTPS